MKKKTLPILLVIIAALILLALGAAYTLLHNRTANAQAVRVFIPEGTSYKGLCDTLSSNNILKSMMVFDIVSHGRGLDKNIRAGSYVVQSGTSVVHLVQKLYRGQQDPLRLTIGKFRLPEQLNQYLDSKLMHNDFNIVLDSFHLILPDTYEVYWTITPQQFMQRMCNEYEKYWEGKAVTNGEFCLNLQTPHDTTLDIRLASIIIASIVEEETNYNPEKPLIASVYWNRLRRGIPLQADPTVKYAVGDFGLRRILNRHLSADSPFNTYLHTGLPPAPICLPSKSSIEAVIDAPETNYLYFCASEKMDGTHRFATTLAEHNRNAAAFHRALNAQGIR